MLIFANSHTARWALILTLFLVAASGLTLMAWSMPLVLNDFVMDE